MSRIVSLSSIKQHRIAIIKEFNANEVNSASIARLMSVGIVPDRDIEVLKRGFGGVIVRVNGDTPMALGRSIDKHILVESLKEDSVILSSKSDKKNFFSRIFDSIKEIKVNLIRK